MSATQQARLAPPLKISELMHSQWAIQVLKTAVELELFTALDGKSSTANEIVGRVKIDPKAGELLLNALLSLDFLQRDGQAYVLTELAATYLVKGKPLYFGEYVLACDEVASGWARLTEIVKSGKPYTTVNEQQTGEQFFQRLAANIFPMSYATAQMVADALHVDALPGPLKVLDLAAGSGVWSIPLAQVNRSLTVDALDFPSICTVAERFAGTMGVAEQYRYLSGDWRNIALEDEHYDFITLGHILHSEGAVASEQLLAKCYKALKKGGTVIVAEFLSNDQRSGPPMAQLFALNMMVVTAAGCVFTVSQLRDLLQKAGLKDVRRVSMPHWNDESPVMVARK